MSHYVVDASVAVKWFVPEVHSDPALRLRDQTHTLHVPAFFTLEFANALCKKRRREELTKAQARYALGELHNIPLFRHADDALLPPPSISPPTHKPPCTTAFIWLWLSSSTPGL